MSVDLSETSIAQWFADREQHRCGYCKNPSGSISYGMLTEELTVEDYKDMIDRGWRRAGKYCYKPTMDKTCCPQYTIRCDAINFTLNKSHKKLIKKFNKFLSDGILNKNIPPDHQNEDVNEGMAEYKGESKINLSRSVTSDEASLQVLKPNIGDDQLPNVPDQLLSQNVLNKDLKGAFKMDNKNESPHCSKDIVKQPVKTPIRESIGSDPNKPLCKKAKLIRLERKKEKLLQKGENFQSLSNKSRNEPKSLGQLLDQIPSTPRHTLRLKLVPTSKRGTEWEQWKDIEYELYVKYQTVVHNDQSDRLNMNSFTRYLASSPLKIMLEKMSKNHITFTKTLELYKKYQMNVHNETSGECGLEEFYDFLVDTPLKPKPFPSGIEGPGYGSFHQQYWIDDKLIAVGVIDILPGCVSSVYFFYDPDYRELTLGTYGSLREIQFIQNLSSHVPDLTYYYMGFYIHSCPKMRYKGKLIPSYLLCPETYMWFPIEQCLRKLDVSKYSRLNDNANAVDSNNCTADDVDSIKVVYKCKLMYLKDFLRLYKADRNGFNNLAKMIGKRSAHSIIFWIS